MLPCSASHSIARSCARCGGAKDAISCAPICADITWRSAVAVLHPARRGRGRLQEHEGRSAIAPDLPPTRAAHRGAHLRCLLRPSVFTSRCVRSKPLAPGLTPRAVLDKLAAVQMLDVHFPTTDHRTLILSPITRVECRPKAAGQKQLKLDLPPQPPPRISTPAPAATNPRCVVETFAMQPLILFTFFLGSESWARWLRFRPTPCLPRWEPDRRPRGSPQCKAQWPHGCCSAPRCACCLR